MDDIPAAAKAAANTIAAEPAPDGAITPDATATSDTKDKPAHNIDGEYRHQRAEMRHDADMIRRVFDNASTTIAPACAARFTRSRRRRCRWNC